MNLNEFSDKYLIKIKCENSSDLIPRIEEEMKNKWGVYWGYYTFHNGTCLVEIIGQSWISIQRLKQTKEMLAIYIPGQIFLGFDGDTFLFNRKNPYICGLKLEIYKELYGYYPINNEIFPIQISFCLREIIMSQHYWGFWLPNPNSPRHKNRIISKEFMVLDIDLDINLITLLDIKTKKQLTLNSEGNGYRLFLSEKLQNEFKNKLTLNWLSYYFNEIDSIDLRISSLKKKLTKLNDNKKKLINSYDDYRKNIKKLIWNS